MTRLEELRLRARRSRDRRGVTLIEVLVVLALVAVFVSITILSFGAVTSARLKRGATQIAGASRIAYAHSTAVSKPVRLVFDFEDSKIFLEEAEGRHLIQRDSTGGADPANEAEQAALDAQDAATMRAPRSGFTATSTIGFPEEGIELPNGIRFWQIDIAHQEQPIREGRAYLYFFPGGQTENASIQLRVSNADEDDTSGYMSVLIAPLTGKTRVEKGRVDAPRPRDDAEASERGDY